MMKNNQSFVELFRFYNTLIADSHKLYADIMALQMLGHCMGRDCKNLISPGVRHNMYTALIGQSTTARKTTTQIDVAKAIFPKGINHPNDFSPEQLMEEFSNNPQYMLWYGEFSTLLKSIGTKSYMSRLAELLNEVQTCPDLIIRKLRGSKTKDGERQPEVFEMRNLYLSFSTTCTPEVMEETLNIEKAKGGFLARFLLAYDPSPDITDRRRIPTEVCEIKKKLSITLERVLQMKACNFELTNEALNEYNRIQRDLLSNKPKVASFIGRYLNYMVAMADILLISDSLGKYLVMPYNKFVREISKVKLLVSLVKLEGLYGLISNNKESYGDHVFERTYSNNFTNFSNFTKSKNTLLVPKIYIQRAYKLILPCLEYAEQVVDTLEIDKPLSKLLKYVNKYENPVRVSKIMQYANISARERNLAEQTAIEREDIIDITINKKNRKPTRWYCKFDNMKTKKCDDCKLKNTCKSQNW